MVMLEKREIGRSAAAGPQKFLGKGTFPKWSLFIPCIFTVCTNAFSHNSKHIHSEQPSLCIK